MVTPAEDFSAKTQTPFFLIYSLFFILGVDATLHSHVCFLFREKMNETRTHMRHRNKIAT